MEYPFAATPANPPGMWPAVRVFDAYPGRLRGLDRSVVTVGRYLVGDGRLWRVTAAQERRDWIETAGVALGRAVCAGAQPGGTVGRVPGVFAWLSDRDRLVVVGRPGERQQDLDLGLAYGIAEAGDRELVLVLPEGCEAPTRRRLPWLDVAVRLYTFAGDGPPVPVPPSARTEVLAGYGDELVTEAHDLGDRAGWVDRLVRWAATTPELVAAHRSSYLAWHCRGRKVLGVRRTRGGLAVTAGVHSTKADRAPASVELTGPMPAASFHRITAAASTAIADRLTGADVANAEHELQERLAELRRRLGLREVVREFPAIRSGGDRGYIDLLAVGADRRIHVVETKIGPDPMLVLQGLDYWIWVSAHRAELVAHLGEQFDADLDAQATPVIDFVLGAKAGRYHHPVTAAVATALDGSIRWRFHAIDGWDSDDTVIASSPPRRAPDQDGGTARYAQRLQEHLLDHAGDAVTRLRFKEPGGGIVEAARPAYADLADRGLTHSYVDHVRSSQAFALNLFAGLDAAELAALWAMVNPAVTRDHRLEFEHSDPADALGEAQAIRPHQTQVDVVLQGRSDGGERHLAFIEVKLSETAFGACSAFDLVGNDTRHLCQQPGAWGGDPAGCFQLRNHDTADRRRYDTHLDPDWITPTSDSACEFLDLNQPMRNVALARALVDRGDTDHVTVAICAPVGNRNVWRQWARARHAFARVPDITLTDLPAVEVAAVHADSRRADLIDRYQLGSP